MIRARVLLNLLNELRKEHFISFFAASTRARMLGPIYHMTLKIL